MDRATSFKTERLIIVRLLGGLGNQMFQYALGRHLSQRLGWPLKLDLNFYINPPPRWARRSFDLGHFRIQAEPATAEELRPFQKYLAQNLFSKFLRRASARAPKFSAAYIHEPVGSNFVFDPAILRLHPAGTIYLDGFWQTEKYFSEIEQIVRQDFEFAQAPDQINQQMLKDITVVNSVAVHIRHGDNATKVAHHHGVLPLGYYHQAIQDLTKSVTDPRFYIFSDDPEWAKSNLKPQHPATFVTHNGEANHHEDLRLMSHCRHHIIGNSTFSWWGAWLGKKPGQQVYAPKRYHMQAQVAISDYYPAGWNLVGI